MTFLLCCTNLSLCLMKYSKITDVLTSQPQTKQDMRARDRRGTVDIKLRQEMLEVLSLNARD